MAPGWWILQGPGIRWIISRRCEAALSPPCTGTNIASMAVLCERRDEKVFVEAVEAVGAEE